MKTRKIFGAVFSLALIVAAAVLIYVNLSKNPDNTLENNIPQETNPSDTVLTLVYSGEWKNFSMAELEQLEPYTAKGGYRTQFGTFAGWGNYTGINMTTLINLFDPSPFQYSLQIFSNNGEKTSYNFTTILGHITIYNPNNASDPNPMGKANLTMVLAYRFEGDWLNESDDGKLKIVFLDEQGSITKSSLWLNKVTSISVITE